MEETAPARQDVIVGTRFCFTRQSKQEVGILSYIKFARFPVRKPGQKFTKIKIIKLQSKTLFLMYKSYQRNRSVIKASSLENTSPAKTWKTVTIELTNYVVEEEDSQKQEKKLIEEYNEKNQALLSSARGNQRLDFFDCDVRF